MHVNNNGGDVLPKPKTFLEAVQQLQNLWGLGLNHSPNGEIFASLEESFFRLAQQDLDAARKFVTGKGLPWLGTHTLSAWFVEQDGLSSGQESVIIDENHAELTVQAQYESRKIKYIIIISPFGSNLKRIERWETIQHLGGEPVPDEHVLVLFEKNKIVSFQREQFRHPAIAA